MSLPKIPASGAQVPNCAIVNGLINKCACQDPLGRFNIKHHDQKEKFDKYVSWRKQTIYFDESFYKLFRYIKGIVKNAMKPLTRGQLV